MLAIAVVLSGGLWFEWPVLPLLLVTSSKPTKRIPTDRWWSFMVALVFRVIMI